MSLLSFLSPALTVATQATGAVQNAQAQARDREQKNTMSMLGLLRQQHLDDSEIALRDAQSKYYGAGVSQRNEDAADKAMHAQTNQRAYGALQKQFTDHPLAQQAFDPGTDYQGALKEAQGLDFQKKQSLAKQKSDYKTLMLEFGNDPLAKAQFDNDNPADYTSALSAARDLRKQTAADTSLDKRLNADSWTLSDKIDPDTGQNYLVNKRDGSMKLAPSISAPKGGAATSGAQTPVADMEQRYSEIEQHAHDLAAKKWAVSNAMQSREALDYGVAKNHANGDAAIGSQLGSGLIGMSGLSGNDADYSRYQQLRNSERGFGDDAAKAFKGRQNEAAVAREIATLGLNPSDYGNDQVVQQKLSRMKHIIEMARLSQPSGAASRGLTTKATDAPAARVPPPSADFLAKWGDILPPKATP